MNPSLTQANALYRSAVDGDDGMSLSRQISTLQRAIAIYSLELKRLANAPLSVENLRAVACSLQKNLGMANLRLAYKMSMEDEVRDALVIYYVEEAVKYLAGSWNLQAQEEKKGTWGTRLVGNMGECFDVAYSALYKADDDKLPHYHLGLKRFLKIFEGDKRLNCFHAHFLLSRANHFFRRGLMTLGDQEFVKTMQLIDYARHDIFALREIGDIELEVEETIQELENDLMFLELSCESVKYRIQADAKYEQFSEPLNVDRMWEVLDDYKAAALASREKDIENESIALTRQGRLYDQVFKVRSKAHEYYRTAFNLASCLLGTSGRNMNRSDWYKEACEALERFQREIVEEEERKRDKERAPYLEKMTEVLLELKRLHNAGDPYKLMAHIFKVHPPKIKFLPYDEKEVNADNLKKTLIRAISYYHPDKQSGQEMEWKILCEEITKCLTARYEVQKGT